MSQMVANLSRIFSNFDRNQKNLKYLTSILRFFGAMNDFTDPKKL